MYWIFVFVIFMFSVPLCIAQENVTVSLYYESHCPYSQLFIENQLYPGYQVLGDALLLDLVPYGNAKREEVDGKWNITCQHGPKECYGNKIQACALAQNLTQSRTLNFIYCVMSEDDPADNTIAKKCASKAKLSWNTIKICANGDQGTELLVHYGEISDSLVPQLKYVPHLLFNGKFNSTLEDESEDNFLKAVCGLFQKKPVGC